MHAPPSTPLQRALALLHAGDARAARDAATLALRTSAHDPTLMLVLARASLALGERPKATYHAQRAVALQPGNPQLLAEGCAVLGESGAWLEVARSVQSAPPAASHPRVLEHITTLCHDAWALDAALACAHVAAARCPTDARCAGLLATSLFMTGQAEDASAAARIAHERLGHAGLLERRAFLHNYVSDDPAEGFRLHRALAETLQHHVPELPLPAWDASPERPLRIGLISGDFFDHSVSRFIRAWLRNHDRAHFPITCFATRAMEDDVTRELRTYARAWRSVAGLSPEQCRAAILETRIDILVDLSGLFPGESLRTLAMRAAPVQWTYVGYPNTTGLTTVDYRIVDAHTDPTSADAHASERLLRLDPCFVCYAPAHGAAAITPKATSSHHPLRFVSCNAIAKHTRETLHLFARALNAAPGSSLTIKHRALGEAGVRTTFLARAREAGLDATHLTLLGHTPSNAEHLDFYRSFDVALDTFPYHGTTTTCDALSMGVPVLSRVGRTHASRVGASLLAAVGLSDLACADDDAFARAAASLHADRARLAHLRATLPETIRASALCSEAAHTQRLESALRATWRERCSRPM